MDCITLIYKNNRPHSAAFFLKPAAMYTTVPGGRAHDCRNSNGAFQSRRWVPDR